MNVSGDHDNSIEFAIAPPFVRRMIALGVTGLFLIPTLWLPLKFGETRFVEAFTESWIGWLVYAMLLSPAAVFFRLAFPPRKSMAMLQVKRDSVSYVPGRWIRRFFAQPEIKVQIPSNAKEILIRHKGLPMGFAVVICSADEHEREMYAGASLTLHNATEGQKIAEGIAAVTGLPTRLVQRQRLSDGTVRETAWIPSSSGDMKSMSLLATGAAPIVGGIAAGYLVSRPAFIVVLGLALWVFLRLSFSAQARRKQQSNSSTIALTTANFFLFQVEYLVIVVIVRHLFSPTVIR